MKKTFICSICKIKPKINTSYCKECSSNYFKEYKKKNPQKSKPDPERYKKNPILKAKRQEYEKKYREKNLQKLKDYGNSYNRIQRQEVIEKYGAHCTCCGEKKIEFLAIDHIKGGGRKHRQSIKVSIYGWLKKNNFPSGFQVLCHNCNSAKAYYGICPHMKHIMPSDLAHQHECKADLHD